MKHEFLNTCNRCFAFFQDITTRPEFDVLVLVSRPRHQDLWSQDQDQDLFSQDRDQDLFFQDREVRDQDQDLRIRSRDGLETKTCLETSHPCRNLPTPRAGHPALYRCPYSTNFTYVYFHLFLHFSLTGHHKA